VRVLLRIAIAVLLGALAMQCGRSGLEPPNAVGGGSADTDGGLGGGAMGGGGAIGGGSATGGGEANGGSGGGASAHSSCQTLVLTFLGCDEERLAECAREYDAVSAVNDALIDQSASCLRVNFPKVADAGWPPQGSPCSPAAVPHLLSAWSQWFHGVCQGANGNAAVNVPADPNFPSCAHTEDAGEPLCFFGDPGAASL
jgi:hypothetical protein